jgi:sporulation protein YlmC with PRC-barrel domain
MKKSMLAALAVGAVLAGAPAFAANPTAGTATVNPNGSTANRPSERNPLLTDDGQVRMSKMVGTSVYNDQDKKIGSVDDVVVGENGQPAVIMKVKGKYVAVPWNKFEFGDAQKNGDNKIIMRGVTEDALASGPEYRYRNDQRG